MLFYVIDSPFNRANYPDMIGNLYSNPPAYSQVTELPDPYRKHSCWKCDLDWMAKVELDNKTINLSGEKSQHCPKCHTRSSMATQWIQSDGSEYPFPEPPKPIKSKE